jgi:transposase-like protein
MHEVRATTRHAGWQLSALRPFLRMRTAYKPAQKQEAVALCRVMGAGAAGQQLGIDPRTIRGWMAQAGDPPELDGDEGTWQRLFDLAPARTEAALASGKLSATATAHDRGYRPTQPREVPRLAGAG